MTLKVVLKKVDTQVFDQRLGIVGYDKDQINKFRKQCKNIKLRHIYFRLISRDFYTKERMLRFRMSRDDECSRCGEVETYKHLFWECRESKRVWNAFNDYMSSINQPHTVEKYDDVFLIDDNRIISMLKVRVIQAMIQIERPSGWGIEMVRRLATELKCIEIYNAAAKHKMEDTKKKWESVK